MKKNLLFLMLFCVTFGLLFGQESLFKLLSEAGDSADFPKSPYVIIFDKTGTEVKDSGLSHVYKEVFYKVLTRKGAKELKSLCFGYDPQSAYIEVKKAKIIKKSGQIIEIPLKKVKDYPAPAWMIYWGAREKILPVGRLEPGDGVCVWTYQKGFTYALLFDKDDSRYIPPMKGHFYDIVPFYSRAPVLTKTYEVTVPLNKKLQFEFYNGEARHYVHNEGDKIRSPLFPSFF